jgi:hypothetical protein
VSGNPAGRPRGRSNRVTIEAREAAARLVDDPQYRQALRQRLLDGTAGAMEVLLWRYAKGPPPERVDDSHGALADMTNEDLKAKLLTAIKTLEG